MPPETDTEREDDRTLDNIERWRGHWRQQVNAQQGYTPRLYAGGEAAFAKRLAKDFGHAEPTPDQRARMDEIRRHCFAAATLMTRYCPESRELSLALTDLQEAAMWAEKAIVREEG